MSAKLLLYHHHRFPRPNHQLLYLAVQYPFLKLPRYRKDDALSGRYTYLRDGSLLVPQV